MEKKTDVILLKAVSDVSVEVVPSKSGKGFCLVLHANFVSGKTWNHTLLWSPVSIEMLKEDN